MLKLPAKTFLFAVLLIFSVSQVAHTETKVYQYDGKLPFIQMMLNMMVAMGVLDRLPNNGRHGVSGFPSNPWGGISNPYARAMAMRGIAPDSPWTQGANSGAGPLWGSPSWGVLPVDSYTKNQFSGNNYGGWSQSDLDGWVNEPWETSAWNAQATAQNMPVFQGKPPRGGMQAQTAQPPAKTTPLVQNFNFMAPPDEWNERGYADNTGQNYQRSGQNRSPLAKLMPPRQMDGRHGGTSRAPNIRSNMRPDMMRPDMRAPNMQPERQAKRSSPLAKKSYHPPRKKFKQAPCVTEFCGLKVPDLNGLWVTQDGEMLGIKNQRYLWSDGKSRYLTGQMKIQNEYLLASVDDHQKLMRFKYKLAGDHLLTMQPDGAIREFVRMSSRRF